MDAFVHDNKVFQGQNVNELSFIAFCYVIAPATFTYQAVPHFILNSCNALVLGKVKPLGDKIIKFFNFKS